MQEFIKARIKSLPPLSDTTIKIQQICADPNASLAELSAVVQSDPMLTANILRSANSPLYGFSREITTIEHAVNLFGMVTVKGFALNAAMKNSFKIELGAYGMSEGSFLDLCTKQSALASGWLARASDEVKRVCVPASFLLEIGRLIIGSELAEQGREQAFLALMKEAKSLAAFCDLEREFVGYSSYEISAMVFDKWALDMDMVEAIAQLKEPKVLNSKILKCVLLLLNPISSNPDAKIIAAAKALCEKNRLDVVALEGALARLGDA